MYKKFYYAGLTQRYSFSILVFDPAGQVGSCVSAQFNREFVVFKPRLSIHSPLICFSVKRMLMLM